MKVLLLMTLTIVLAVGCDQGIDGTANRSADRDNTIVNQRDADGINQTPFDQSNKQSDIDLVAKIRQEILEIEDLSVNGRNVKIITNNGNVLLRGPVQSTTEKEAIDTVARENAAAGTVTNELEVVTD